MKFSTDEMLGRLVTKVIAESRGSDLDGCSIKAVFKDGKVGDNPMETEQGKKIKIAKAQMLSPLIRYVSKVDFILEVSKPHWLLLDNKETMEAVIDEALARCGYDKETGRPFTVEPDAVFYSDVIARRGFAYSPQMKAVEERVRQLGLFTEGASQKAAA